MLRFFRSVPVSGNLVATFLTVAWLVPAIAVEPANTDIRQWGRFRGANGVAGIEIVNICQHHTGKIFGDLIQPDQRCISNCLEYIIFYIHSRC